MHEIVEKDHKLYDYLTAHNNNRFYIKINDNLHEVPTVGIADIQLGATAHSCSDELNHEKWYDVCTKKGLSTIHASTLSTFIHQFERCLNDNVDAKKYPSRNTYTESELGAILNESLKFFDDVVVREQIYRLNIKRTQVKDEIAKLDAIKSALDARAAKRNRMFF